MLRANRSTHRVEQNVYPLVAYFRKQTHRGTNTETQGRRRLGFRTTTTTSTTTNMGGGGMFVVCQEAMRIFSGLPAGKNARCYRMWLISDTQRLVAKSQQRTHRRSCRQNRLSPCRRRCRCLQRCCRRIVSNAHKYRMQHDAHGSCVHDDRKVACVFVRKFVFTGNGKSRN